MKNNTNVHSILSEYLLDSKSFASPFSTMQIAEYIRKLLCTRGTDDHIFLGNKIFVKNEF